jgi:hypothetical protein
MFVVALRTANVLLGIIWGKVALLLVAVFVSEIIQPGIQLRMAELAIIM